MVRRISVFLSVSYDPIKRPVRFERSLSRDGLTVVVRFLWHYWVTLQVGKQ